MDGAQNAIGLVHFSLQIPVECTCSAYLCPKLIETSVLLRKTDVSLCIHGAPGGPNELRNLISDGPKCKLGSTFC